MTTDKTVTLEIDGYNIPKKPIDFIAFWKEKFMEVPEEFRDTARIIIEAETEYGDPVLNIMISYSRPETVDEMRIRECEIKRIELSVILRAQATLARYGVKND